MQFVSFADADSNASLDVIVAAMQDNPMHIAALGTDQATRERRLREMFGMLETSPALQEHSIVGIENGQVVGAVGLMAPGTCQPSIGQQLKMAPTILKLGLGTARRIMTWRGGWARQDISEPHWHVGPMAVAPDRQGQGIGSALMAEALRAVDTAGGVAYLETDREINVRFYEKLGFEVIGKDTLLGTTSWYMRRPAQVASGQTAA